jgi:hypothetical protein
MAKLKWAMHCFLVGLGSVLTVQAGPKPSYLTRPLKESLAKDWEAVGHDLSLSVKKFPDELTMVQPELGLESDAKGSKPVAA